MAAFLIFICLAALPIVFMLLSTKTYLSGKAQGEKLIQQADWKYNGKAYLELEKELGRTPTIDELAKVHKDHPII